MKQVYWLVFAHMACGSSGGRESDTVKPVPDAGGPTMFPCTGGQPDTVATAVGNPTGTISSAADAQGVAGAFEALLAVGGGTEGRRRDGIDCSGAKTNDYTCSCSQGGELAVRVLGNAESYEALYNYRDCCITDCCYDGCGWFGAPTNGSFDQCASFSMTASCPDDVPVEYAYCVEAGITWHLVEYQAESFAVTGFYDSVSGGNWTIRDALTEWACSEEDTGSGSCTDGTNTLTW